MIICTSIKSTIMIIIIITRMRRMMKIMMIAPLPNSMH